MTNPSQENPFDADRYRDAEAQLGGADSVEKTTYVVGEGTQPERRHDRRAPAANVSARGGSGMLIAIVVALVALAAIAYLLGVAA